ncbi:MAG: bifunctional folylpolyglutamate synthase/dihydrofolate synthase [Paludibacteraceae bacterium]|nr:bifunctional folylpolyglutamate synthase/dihydrofolate synthase [Paludibacteraceae bacterium]
MDYSETLQYLYVKTPMFQQQGQSAYKPGIDTVLQLDAHYGHPHRAYPTVHVAGTNGKGSTTHTIAAVLQAAGYRVGLYTSPHLKDFAERIRVNGQPIDHDYVVRFVAEAGEQIDRLQPSFFEITTLMAFCYFRDMHVDVAVIEVGLGGRLDSTNIITPLLSVITNISLDHTKLLGSTVEQIAVEKAGIIKPGVPVVVGEASPALRAIYDAKADLPVVYAEDNADDPRFDYELKGDCQTHNKKTILAALQILRPHFGITDEAVAEGLSHVVEMTGLMGRWQTLSEHPTVIADTGHNEGGIRYIAHQLENYPCRQLRIVFGMVGDKDIRTCLSLMPVNARYYFCNAAIQRALPAADLKMLAAAFGLEGEAYASVQAALEAAKADAADDDLIFVGGSNFTVAEIL